MEVDYTGANAVSNVIKISKLSKFIIYKLGASRHSTPVYEHTSSTSNERALDAFSEWSRIASDSANCYEMLLFNGTADYTDSPDTKGKKEKAIRFSFSLSRNNQYNQNQDRYQPSNSNADVSTLVENAMLKMKAEYDAKDNKRMFDELSKKIDELNEEDEFDPNDSVNGNSTNDLIKSIGMIMNGMKNKNAGPVLNGTVEEKQNNCIEAIKILSKHDPEIDTHLLKLASISENNKPMFQMILLNLKGI